MACVFICLILTNQLRFATACFVITTMPLRGDDNAGDSESSMSDGVGGSAKFGIQPVLALADDDGQTHPGGECSRIRSTSLAVGKYMVFEFAAAIAMACMDHGIGAGYVGTPFIFLFFNVIYLLAVCRILYV